MAEVNLEHVYKIYDNGYKAVNDFNLKIKDTEFLVLVGPSGCGKSTTLRMIAGLEEISKGTVSIGDRVVNDIPPKNRDIAMVFQNYALYPHMTVYDNMAFGLKLRGLPKDEIDKRVSDAAKILGLEALLERRPKQLSGGQRQRVAMGRAIVREPAVFLFDEPLSNLDAKMRVEMRKEILQLHRRIKATMVYVTHDQIEAMTLGDRICVMNVGIIEQVGAPTQIFDYPASLYVARFIGTPPMNIFNGILHHEKGKLVFDGGSVKCPVPEDKCEQVKNHVGKKICLGIRPRAFKLAKNPSPTDIIFRGVPEVSEMLGEEILAHFRCGDNVFIASVDPHDIEALDREEVELTPDLAKAHIFDLETGVNLTLPDDIRRETVVVQRT